MQAAKYLQALLVECHLGILMVRCNTSPHKPERCGQAVLQQLQGSECLLMQYAHTVQVQCLQ